MKSDDMTSPNLAGADFRRVSAVVVALLDDDNTEWGFFMKLEALIGVLVDDLSKNENDLVELPLLLVAKQTLFEDGLPVDLVPEEVIAEDFVSGIATVGSNEAVPSFKNAGSFFTTL